MRNNLDLLKSKNVNIDNINLDITSPASGSKEGGAEGGSAAGGSEEKEGKSQKRGGKGATIKNKKLEKAVAASEEAGALNVSIKVGKKMQGKRRCVTMVKGLATANVDQKKAAKAFKQKFACASSVVNPEEVMIQGEFVDDVIELLQSKF